MFYNNIDPVLFRIGVFEVRYYGIIFVLGFVIAYFFINYLAKERKIRLKKDEVIDFLFYILVGAVAGARLFYVLFYNLKFYLMEPLQIFALWHGGLSFHGGLVGALIAVSVFCKKKKTGFYEMTDILAIPLAFGLALGRMGNFLNSELVGRITNVKWAVKFRDYDGFRHPSQLYESLKNFFIFFVLWLIRNKKLKKGFLTWLFVIMYSVLRFFIEFFRMPDPQLGFVVFGLTIGQVLSVILFFVGVYFIAKLK